MIPFFFSKPTCRKFFTYATKTIDFSGLSAGLSSSELADFDLKLGQFKLSPEFVKVSEKLMQMDMQQYDICQTISNIRDKNERDRKFSKLAEIKIEMMRMAAHPEAYEHREPTILNSGQYWLKADNKKGVFVQGLDGEIIKVFADFAEIESFILSDEKSSPLGILMKEFFEKRKGEKWPATLLVVQLLENNRIPEALEEADKIQFIGEDSFLYQRKKENYYADKLDGQALLDWVRKMKVFFSRY